MTERSVRVYTDGGCIGNPGPGGWGIRIRYEDGRFEEYGGGGDQTTNNRMELQAVIEALRHTTSVEEVMIVMDSEYVRMGITSWLKAWKAGNWMTKSDKPVANQDLWRTLDGLLRPGVVFRYTAGHAGDPDNERCDRIANGFARQQPVSLENGVDHTPFAPLESPERLGKHGMGKKKKGPTTYLSYVDGRLKRHSTWAECEREVKGRSGARYKKCFSPEEEMDLLKKWGVSQDISN
ncbi:MAG: viroplasmin family protein [Planctomycetes bacterium]|nr:viroplasmin family protein [Planctomycetota bacterium]